MTSQAVMSRMPRGVLAGRWRLARLLLGQPVQAAIELAAVLIKECLELGTGWLIDDILSERCWQERHKRSISGALPTRKVHLIGRQMRSRGRAVRLVCFG
jgi:hypothetical protein